MKITLNLMFAEKTLYFCHYVRNVVVDVITFPEICKPIVVYRFYCMVVFQSRTRRHMIMNICRTWFSSDRVAIIDL